MKNLSKPISILVIFLFTVSGFCIAASALAAVTVRSVTMNGASDSIVEAGQQVTATVQVDLTGNSLWKSTAYRFGNGNWNCIDIPGETGGAPTTQTFPITAPLKQGVSGINVEVYENVHCSNSVNLSVASASILTGAMNVFSLLDYTTWFLGFSALVIIILVAVIVFRFKKKRSDDKN